MIKTFENSKGILFIFIPFFLIIGPAIADISVSLIGFLFILISILKKDYTYYRSKFVIFIFFWNFYLITISLFSENSLLSLESSLFYFRFIFFSLGVWYIFEHKSKYVNLFFWFLLASFFILIIDGYYQMFNGVNLLGYPIVGTRIASLFKEELILGSYLSRLFPLLFGLMIYLYSNKKNLFYLIFTLFILTDSIIFLSGERSALFYLLLSSIFIIIFVKKWKIARIVTLILSFLLLIFFSVLNNDYKKRIVDYTFDQITQTDGNDKINLFSIQHEVIYKTSIKIFIDYPFFGIGPKNFRFKCKEDKYKSYTKLDGSIDGCQTSPHNYYIQILAETGIIGMLFFLVFPILFFKLLMTRMFSKKNNQFSLHDFEICLLSCLLITFWPFVPTGNVFNNWINVVHYLPLGMLLFIQNKYKN